MTTDDEYGDLHVTCTDDGEAERIAAALVEHRLAACVQLTPVRSVFHWDDRVEQDDEILLVAKARRDRFEASVALIQDLHSYELPAITFHPTAPSEPTATWIDQSLGTAENDT